MKNIFVYPFPSNSELYSITKLQNYRITYKTFQHTYHGTTDGLNIGFNIDFLLVDMECLLFYFIIMILPFISEICCNKCNKIDYCRIKFRSLISLYIEHWIELNWVHELLMYAKIHFTIPPTNYFSIKMLIFLHRKWIKDKIDFFW